MTRGGAGAREERDTGNDEGAADGPRISEAKSLFLVIPEESAIDDDGGTGDVVGIRGGEEEDGSGNVARLAKAAQGDIGEKGGEFVLVVEKLGVDGGLDGARGDVIDGDIEWGELDGEVAAEHLEAAFAGAI